MVYGESKNRRSHGGSGLRLPPWAPPRERAGIAWFAGRRSSGGYAVAGLALLAFLGAWSLGVVGCSALLGYGQINEAPGSLFTNMPLSSGEISRLESNAHYYKLMGSPSWASRNWS